MKRLSLLLFALFTALLLLGVFLWHGRVKLVSRMVDRALARQGVDDLSYRLTWLTPWRLVLRDLRWGSESDPLLVVDRIDLRYSIGDLKRGHLERAHVQGAWSVAVVTNGTVALPLVERLQKQLAHEAPRAEESAAVRSLEYSLWMATLREVVLELRGAPHAPPLAFLTLNLGAVAEQEGRYRLWGQVEGALPEGRERVAGAALASLRLAGSVAPAEGAVALTPALEIDDLASLLELARQIAPEAGLGVVPEKCRVAARGDFAVSGWTNLAPFQASLELGRNGTFKFSEQEAWLRFQSLRLEAAGTLDDLELRVNAGVSGFEFGRDMSVTQEQGRLLTLRANTRYQRDAHGGQSLTGEVNSDLPGRSVAAVLPRLLPLVPVFFSDGGRLQAELQLSCTAGGQWQGQIGYAAAAERSSLPIADMHVGAGAVRVEGTLGVNDSKAGEVRAEVAMERVYAFRDGVTLRGGLRSSLKSEPPYDQARLTFSGEIDGLLARLPLTTGEGGIAFEGTVQGTTLSTKPEWRANLSVPFDHVLWTQGVWRAECALGAGAEILYSADTFTTDGSFVMRDLALASGAEAMDDAHSGALSGGVRRVEARFDLRRSPESESLEARVVLGADNVWLRGLDDTLRLEDGHLSQSFTWSDKAGLAFTPPARLSWRDLEIYGLHPEPREYAWSTTPASAKGRLELAIRGSALKAGIDLEVPLADPAASRLSLEIPWFECAHNDALAALIAEKGEGVEVAGRATMSAGARLLGAQPHITGRLLLEDGTVRQADKTLVQGVAAEVPFISGVISRTIEKPFVSFKSAKIGDVVLDGGRMDFQVTRRGIFVERLEVALCKGHLNAYSIDWQFKNPRDEFVLYADRIDLGEALMMTVPLKGNVEGVLYGRVPVGIDGGKVKLSPGFLYSLPGQGGKLRMDDNLQMRELLDRSGIQGDMQEPLSKALSDMDFNALRFELEPRADGEGTLRIKLTGKSNSKDWPAPVDLSLNLHGPLEKIVNLGLDMSRK